MRFSTWTWLGVWLVIVGWIVYPFGGLLLEALGQAEALQLLPPHIVAAQPFVATQVMVCGFALAIASLAVEVARTNRAGSSAPGPANESGEGRLVLLRDGARQTRVVRFGVLRDRPYAMFDDGSLAVGTLLGVRTFASLPEVAAFVGGGEGGSVGAPAPLPQQA